MKNVQHGSLFSQLLSLFNRNDFSRHVRDLEAEYGSKGFSCWDQFVSMLFCHLAQAKSLREITQGLKSSQGRLSHLGMKEAPKRSTLSYANQHRTRELYERLFYDLLQVCRDVAPRKKNKFRFKNKLMSIDASIIELCIEMFDCLRGRSLNINIFCLQRQRFADRLHSLTSKLHRDAQGESIHCLHPKPRVGLFLVTSCNRNYSHSSDRCFLVNGRAGRAIKRVEPA